MPPLVVLIGIVEVQVFGKLLPKAEGSTTLSFMLRPMQLRLHNSVFWAPGVGKVNIFQINGFKAVVPPC